MNLTPAPLASDYFDSCTRHIALAELPEGNPADVRASILLEATVPAVPTRVWAALTTPDELRRWFAPVTGDLSRGGSYYVAEASWGTVLESVTERRFSCTWNFDDRTSLLNVDITPPFDPELENNSTLVSIAHGSDMRRHDWEAYGVLAVGAAWDAMVFKLSRYLLASDPDQVTAELREWEASPDAARFTEDSLQRWTEATADYGIPQTEADAMLERAFSVLRDTE